MPNDNIESRLCAYIDGLLDAEQREAIEQYLDRYPEHRQLIDQLMQERSLLRDMPRESAPADVLAHFQGQLERSVLLGDLDMDFTGTGRVGRRGRWNLAVLLALVLLAFGVSVIVWIAMPPKRVHQSAGALMVAQPLTTLPVDTTQSSATAPSTEPGVSAVRAEQAPVLPAPRAMVVDVSGSNVLIVMISAPDLLAVEGRVGAFLQARSLRHTSDRIENSSPATLPATIPTHEAWDVPGMTGTQADDLVRSFAMLPATYPAATEPATQRSTTQPAASTQMSAATQPTTAPALGVMIIFQTADFQSKGAENTGI